MFLPLLLLCLSTGVILAVTAAGVVCEQSIQQYKQDYLKKKVSVQDVGAKGIGLIAKVCSASLYKTNMLDFGCACAIECRWNTVESPSTSF